MDCFNIDRECLILIKLHISDAYVLCEASTATSKGRWLQSHGLIVTLSYVVIFVDNVSSKLFLEVSDLVTVRHDDIEHFLLAFRVQF